MLSSGAWDFPIRTFPASLEAFWGHTGNRTQGVSESAMCDLLAKGWQEGLTQCRGH